MVTLVVPAGALDNTIPISIKESDGSGDIGSIGKTYDFGPDGLIFNIPVLIKMKYDPSSIPAGINETDLQLAYFSVNGWELIDSSVADKTTHVIEGNLVHFSTVGLQTRNPYPITVVKETDFTGHLATSFRIPVGDDKVNDLGDDLSLLLIDNFIQFQYPKIIFNIGEESNRWYVAVAFNVNRTLSSWNIEPSSSDDSYYRPNGKPDGPIAYHPGEDWNLTTGGMTDKGMPVHAIANGIVLFNGWKWGNTIILGHKLASGEIITSLYAHLMNKPALEHGNIVNKGDKIGEIGDTGAEGAFHLHFEMAKGIGADGTAYMLKKNSSGDIVFSNEKIRVISGQQYYEYFWLWPGNNSKLIDSNWYDPSLFIRDFPRITQLNGQINAYTTYRFYIDNILTYSAVNNTGNAGTFSLDVSPGKYKVISISMFGSLQEQAHALYDQNNSNVFDISNGAELTFGSATLDSANGKVVVSVTGSGYLGTNESVPDISGVWDTTETITSSNNPSLFSVGQINTAIDNIVQTGNRIDRYNSTITRTLTGCINGNLKYVSLKWSNGGWNTYYNNIMSVNTTGDYMVGTEQQTGTSFLYGSYKITADVVRTKRQ